MKNKKVNKIIIYTLIVFGISSFSCFPKSYSKYIKEETPIRYYVGIDKLYIGEIETIRLSSSTSYEYVQHEFSFNRSQSMKDYDTRQEIIIEIAEPTCEITNVSSKGSVTKNNNIATITYSPSDPIDDKISVNYRCRVNDITITENEIDYIASNVLIYDQFLPSNENYLYLKGKFKELLSTYKFNHPEPSTELTFDSRNLVIPASYTDSKYEAFKNWLIAEYGSTHNNQYDQEILKYVRKVYNSDSDITDVSKNLKGLSVRYDQDSDSFIYQIDDNFIGYARTYYAYEGPGIFLKAVFINNSLNDSELNEMFESYLQEYSTYNPNQIDIIMNYISHYGSLNYIIKPETDGSYKTIPGFEYNSGTQEIQIEDSLYYIALSHHDKKIYIKRALASEMYFFYKKVLPVAYRDLPVDMLNLLKSNSNILKTVMKYTDSNPDEFSEYFVVKNNETNDYVLVNIYSIISEGMNCVEVIELGNKPSNIEMTKVDNKLNVTVTLDNQDTDVAKTNLTDIVTKLDSYFGTNYKNEIDDSLFIGNSTTNITSVIDGNNITITYSIIIQ